MLLRPTRVHEKSARFHISAHGCAKNTPDFTFPNRDAPKTRPVLHPNLRRETFRGVCNTPLYGYMKNPPGCRPKPSARDISGRMLLRPTRVRAKPVRFHIPAHGYTKNVPDFTHPNKDTPKTYPVLAANSCRKTFRGVCNTPLHGYVQNLAGFTFPHTDTSKTHPISSFPIRIPPNPARF